jgi:uncharacterized protein YcaQ
MPKTQQPQIRNAAIANFRLRRNHLLRNDDDAAADAVTISRDMCGVQAQVMSAAYLQLWARNHALTRSEIEDALWKTRTLVKTSLMRQTLHLIPADEFPLYIAALRPSRVAQALRTMARFGISREEGESITPLIMDALSAGPLRRPAIAAVVRPKVSKRARAWMEACWSMIRIPVAEGSICYGRGEGNEIVFIRTDQWLKDRSIKDQRLPKLKVESVAVTQAQCELFQKYLRAYGPASLHDFAHWSGISMQEVKPLLPLLQAELAEIPGEKKDRWLFPEDVAILNKTSTKETGVRLLPIFDSFLLAHREKDHLLSMQHYKRVYRNQGWISPVVLVDGAIAGVWSHKIQNKKLFVEVDPFGRLTRTQRAAIKREAEALAVFFESKLDLKFS